MEDIQLIIYIIFAVLYLIYKAMQKGKEASQDKQQNTPQTPRRKEPPKTFEELLREFSGEPYGETARDEEVMSETFSERNREKKPVERRAPERQAEKRSEYFTYEKEDDQRARQIYQDSIQRARSSDNEFRNDEIKVGKIQVIEDKDEKDQVNASEILDGLRNAKEVKKAFVYSEIFNKKYV